MNIENASKELKEYPGNKIFRVILDAVQGVVFDDLYIAKNIEEAVEQAYERLLSIKSNDCSHTVMEVVPWEEEQ